MDSIRLLLHLVQRDGVDLCTLPLVHITREYLAALTGMQALELDVAGEFLVMAATLCELKSRELLPGFSRERTRDAEEEDPREALVLRIIAYQRFRQAAQDLADCRWLGRDSFARPARSTNPRERPVEPGVDALGLRELYERSLRRSQRPDPVLEVTREPLRWADTVQHVLRSLDDGQTRSLDELLAGLADRPSRIMAFLAVLELCRLRAVGIEQREHLSPVLLKGLVRAEDAALSQVPEAV